MKPSLLLFFISAAIILTQTLALQLTYPSSLVCLLPSAPRGTPKSPSLVQSCGTGFGLLEDRKCYGPCPPGLDFYWPGDSNSKYCIEKCTQDYKMFNGVCFFSGVSKVSRLGTFTTLKACENVYGSGSCTNDNSIYYIPWCSTPFSNTSYQCRAKEQARIIAPARVKLACEKGYENVDGLCYPECSNGYQGLGEVCVGKCKAGFTQCGKFCARGISCQSYQVASFEDFVESARKEASYVDFSRLVCA